MATTVCPSHILAADPEVDQLIAWFLGSSPFGGMVDVPTGPPEWPYRGGLLRQPARLVQAVTLMRAELAHVKHKETAPRKSVRA